MASMRLLGIISANRLGYRTTGHKAVAVPKLSTATNMVKWCDEAPRRRDTPRRGGKESYGGLTSKTPSINPAKVDVFGIGIPTGKVGYDTVATSFGSVKVPKEVDTMQYIPTGDTLHFLTHSQGSRLLPHPPRYFP